jgi:hypothetical protein
LGKIAAYLRGRCFNCLARDHKRVLCRDPSNYWRCKKSGHISSSCMKSHVACSKLSSTLPPSSHPVPPPSVEACMDHHRSFGATPMRRASSYRQDAGERNLVGEPRGNAVNYPSNPRFRPPEAFKFVATSEDMEQRRFLLTNHALVITQEGPMGVQSREEVKTLIMHYFGIRKHELYVYRSRSESFIVIFSKGHARNLVFAAGAGIS